MRIPLVRTKSDDSPIGRWEWLFAPVTMPMVVVGLAVAAAVSLFAMPFVLLGFQRRSWRFATLMRRKERFIAWSQLSRQLDAGGGTLIVEQAKKEGIRVWWV